MAKKLRIIILFISLSLSLGLMSNTYSRYIANTTGNLEVLFAKWQILVNSTDISDGSTSTITLVPVIAENENVAANTVAPSSEGYFDIEINPTNVDVSFDYSISLAFENENVPDLVITKYSIIDDLGVEGTINTLSNNVISNTLNYDNSIENFSFKTFTVRVYFEWYEGENEVMTDTDDTLIGENAANGVDESFKINASISFEQKIN